MSRYFSSFNQLVLYYYLNQFYSHPGLKTVISELPPSSTVLAGNICKKITDRLTSAITKQEDVSVQLEALDILADLLSRYGGEWL